MENQASPTLIPVGPFGPWNIRHQEGTRMQEIDWEVGGQSVQYKREEVKLGREGLHTMMEV